MQQHVERGHQPGNVPPPAEEAHAAGEIQVPDALLDLPAQLAVAGQDEDRPGRPRGHQGRDFDEGPGGFLGLQAGDHPDEGDIGRHPELPPQGGARLKPGGSARRRLEGVKVDPAADQGDALALEEPQGDPRLQVGARHRDEVRRRARRHPLRGEERRAEGPRLPGVKPEPVNRVDDARHTGQARRQAPHHAGLGRMRVDDVRPVLPEHPHELRQRRQVPVRPDAALQRGDEPDGHSQARGLLVQDSPGPAEQARRERLFQMGDGVQGVVLRPAELQPGDHVADAHLPPGHAASLAGDSRRDRSHSSRTRRVQIISS